MFDFEFTYSYRWLRFAFQVGWGPELANPTMQLNMRNLESTVILLGSRAIMDFESAPAGLRRPVGDKEVGNLQKVCRMFEIALDKLSAKISDESLAKHKGTLTAAFNMKAMDCSLQTMVDGQAPFTFNDLPDFAAVLQHEALEVEHRQSGLDKDLAQKILQASFSQLQKQLQDDEKHIIEFLEHKRAMITEWQWTVMAFKRKRYANGLEAVRCSLMSHTIRVSCCEDIAQFAGEIAAFKTAFEAEAGTAAGKSCIPQ